jgi:tRNA (cmo5U34)-methyltransferase
MSSADSIQTFDEERAAGYDDRIRRVAPGYDLLQDAVASALETTLGEDARLLVVGAGTGAEIRAMGRARPGWHFTAVDPSAAMLDRCRRRMQAAGLDERVTYVCERVEDWTPSAPFDGATAVFVSHFLDAAATRRFFGAVARSLQKTAPLVVADLFADGPGTDPERLRAAWRRWCLRNGMSDEEVETARARMDEGISAVSEATLTALLGEVGCAAPTRLFQCFRWGAWWTRRVESPAEPE